MGLCGRWWLGALALLSTSGCGPGSDLVGDEQVLDELADDPLRYLDDREYRRAILERDLVERDNKYSQLRLQQYAVEGGWDELPTQDLASARLSPEVAAGFRATATLVADQPLRPLVPDELPQTDDEWIALGERVFFEYPVAPQPALRRLLAEDALASVGYLEHDGAYVGLRLVEVEGELELAGTCAACHASVGPDGRASGMLANRQMNLAARRAITNPLGGNDSPVDQTGDEDLHALAAGRSDVFPDGVFNPYAFPDFGGIADLPYLHHTANWHHRGTATMAIRVETVFITGMGQERRIPRVLSWALASYIRSLPPPPPLEPDDGGPEVRRGGEVFVEAGCDGCHAPPLYTSDRLVGIEEIGTDPAAGESDWRWTGHYRIPSLRGVSRTAPYLHHGAFETLEDMFDPAREEPGHEHGLELGQADRAALIRFLRSL